MTGRAHQRAAALVTVLSSAVGVLLGLVWWLVTPLARLEKRADGVFGVGRQAETAVAADGWFAVCGLVAGVVVALVAAFLVRERLAALVGLAAGGVLGSVVAWRVGALLGPGPLQETAEILKVGQRFDGPLTISALGVLLAWSMAAVAAFFAAVAGLDANRPDHTTAADSNR